MKKIINIVKIPNRFHPAVGNYYTITLDDNSTVEVSDDELMGRYASMRKRGADPKSLIDEMFNLKY